MNLSPELLVLIITVIFGAGVNGATLRRLQHDVATKAERGDVNAIGAKQRRFEKNLVLVLLAITEKPEHRIFLAQFLKDP